MTATQKAILGDLTAGGWLDNNGRGETVRVRDADGKVLRYTTRKTIRAMVEAGLLTRQWTLGA